MLSTSFAYLQLTRPANVLIAFASVQVGTLCAYGEAGSGMAVLAGLSMGALCAAANASNDYFDVEIDRQNKPRRPLAAGLIPLRSALVFALCLYGAGILSGARISLAHLAVALGVTILSMAYNAGLKRRGVAGNATVSGVAATAFLYGGLLGPRPFLALIPVGFAFLFHFGREIIKDMEDAAGDRAGRVRSIPLEYGVPGARIMITAAFLALIVLTLVPAYAGWYGLPYAGLVVPVDLVLLYVLRALWRDASPPSAGRLSRILKADMVLGLAALCLGRI